MIQSLGYLLIRSFWLILPAGFANMAPVLTYKLHFLAYPADFGKKIKGKLIFGSHKTLGGIIGAIISGGLVFFIQRWLYDFSFFRSISILNYTKVFSGLGVFFGLGTIFGDLIKSFLKRRLGIPPGQSWFPFDQLDWIIGALIFICLVISLSKEIIIVSIILGFLLHILFKFFGFLLKINKTYI